MSSIAAPITSSAILPTPAYANWLALIMVVLPVLTAFMRRIGIEERALSQALGERYTHYMARTKRLIPGVY
jgi:protein-S-isoprenylcysteine O-methyltransferase Ste14